MSILSKFHSARRGTRLVLAAILLLAIWKMWRDDDNRQTLRAPITTTDTSAACVGLRPRMYTHQDAVIRNPGSYCVETDFWQRLLHGAGHSWPGSHHRLIDVMASNVTIDLKNHILRSDGPSTGIGVSLDDQNWVKTRTITIKNGVIDLRGSGTGVESHHKWQMYFIDEPVPAGLTGYDEPSFILENVLIKTDNVGIALTGDGNIIRNCVIESGGGAAIIMAGPNGQIINNTIVLSNPFVPGSMRGNNFNEPRDVVQVFATKKRPMAAIALHQATGTVIHGNRIEVKGKSVTRHNIFLNNGSKDVRIEGNTFVGSNDPVTLVNGSTAILKDNVFEQRTSWWKF